MDYPFVSRNNLPIKPGDVVTYKSRRYGEVFGEVTKCTLKQVNVWSPGKGYTNRKTVAKITVRVQKPATRRYGYRYAVSMRPERVDAII